MHSLLLPWGLPVMTSRKFTDFVYPLPLVTITNQLIVFLSSAFWGPAPPLSAEIIDGSPLLLLHLPLSNNSSLLLPSPL